MKQERGAVVSSKSFVAVHSMKMTAAFFSLKMTFLTISNDIF
jgi:hypothetical protein